MQWRPIDECPPDLMRATIYAPDNFWYQEHEGRIDPARLHDERVVTANRGPDGTWRVAHDQGGWSVTPTHFLDAGLPPGCPVTLDVVALQADLDRERAETARLAPLRAAEARTRREAADRTLAASYEAYWADVAAKRRTTP